MKSWQKLMLVFMPWALTTAIASGPALMAKETPALRGKTETIGSFTWYTEQNSLKEITEIANKAEKPILAVFSATWCKPCQYIKKKVFQSEEFNKVADRVIPLYIEGTTPQGKKYARKFRVNAYPTFKLFSKKGIYLDTGQPERTVKGFLHWIDEVNGGNSYYRLSKKLEKNPNDRKTLIDITARMSDGNIVKKRQYLEKALQLNRDFNDPLTHKAGESLAHVLLTGLPGKKDKNRKAYIKTYRPIFEDIFDAYYPDKFKYGLKGFEGLWIMITWFRETSNHPRAVSLLEDFLKKNKIRQKSSAKFNMALAESLPLLATAFNSFLFSGKTEEAKKWLARVEKIGRSDKKASGVRGFAYNLFNMYRDIIAFYGKKGEISKAESYASTFYTLMERTGNSEQAEETAYQFAVHYGIFAQRVLERIDEKLKTAKRGRQKSHLISGKAKVLAAMGKKKEARKALVNLSKDEEFLKTLSPKETAGVLNVLAWTMVEMDMIDTTTLEMAKKAAQLYPDSGMILDTLACTYAGLGQYDKALEIETKAINKLENPSWKREFLARIREWKKKVNSEQ